MQPRVLFSLCTSAQWPPCIGLHWMHWGGTCRRAPTRSQVADVVGWWGSVLLFLFCFVFCFFCPPPLPFFFIFFSFWFDDFYFWGLLKKVSTLKRGVEQTVAKTSLLFFGGEGSASTLKPPKKSLQASVNGYGHFNIYIYWSVAWVRSFYIYIYYFNSVYTACDSHTYSRVDTILYV